MEREGDGALRVAGARRGGGGGVAAWGISRDARSPVPYPGEAESRRYPSEFSRITTPSPPRWRVCRYEPSGRRRSRATSAPSAVSPYEGSVRRRVPENEPSAATAKSAP